MDYELPICHCGGELIYISKKIVSYKNTMGFEVRKILKSGKPSKTVFEVRNWINFNIHKDFFECIECKSNWEATYDGLGRIL